MWLSQIWTTQWLIIHLIPLYFRCKICKLFHFYILFTYSLIAEKIKCNVSGKIFHDYGDTAMSNSRKFWVYHCFRWVCYETAAHQPETPNLYTSTPMIVMKEKIKPNHNALSRITMPCLRLSKPASPSSVLLSQKGLTYYIN